LIGRDAYFQVEATRHHPNEFVVLVGDSAIARKGSSFDHVARLLSHTDTAFTSRLTTGLSSGEGLIWAVRDPHGPDPGAQEPLVLRRGRGPNATASLGNTPRPQLRAHSVAAELFA